MNYHRQSIRLKEYDYSREGAYFITICTQDMRNMFGEIVDGKMVLNYMGRIAYECWFEIVKHFKNVTLDEFVVMPDHVHGIIDIVGAWHAAPMGINQGMACHAPTQFGKLAPGSLSTIVGSYKSATTKQINILRKTPGMQIWQRNYCEHIIRNEKELNEIREYINNNPLKREFKKIGSY